MHFQGQKLAHGFRKRSTFGSMVTTLMIAVLLVAWSAQTMGQRTVITSSDKRVIISNNKVHHSRRSGVMNSFNIEYKGDIEVTDDDRDIKSISSGGYFEVSKTTFGSKRSIVIESRSGGLRKQYFEGRKELEWEPNGREWLAEILPDIVRSTGIASESRVNRYYQKGGVDAVLDEISRLDSDYVKAIYAKKLLAKKGLSNNDLAAAVKEFGDEIDSDYYLSQILKENSDLFLRNDQLAEAYLGAVKNIGSDHYSSSILKDAMSTMNPLRGH